MTRIYLISMLTLCIGCVNKIEDIKFTYSDNTVHDYGKEIKMQYFLKGNLEFELFTSEIQTVQSPKEKTLFPNGIQIFAYNKALDTIATISSDFAIENKHNEIVEVKKNVILKNNQQHQLSTEQLFWDRQNKIIYTDGFVTLKTKNQIIMGFGFTADQYFSTYSLSNITGTIYL